MRRFPGILASVFVCFFIVQACGNDSETHDLTGHKIFLNWTFSDASDCTEANASLVYLNISQGEESGDGYMLFCSSSGKEFITDVTDGKYLIRVMSVDNVGDPNYYGEERITIRGKDENLIIYLNPAGFMTFTWDLAGRTCTEAGVENVSVKVNTEDGYENLYTASPILGCDDGGHNTYEGSLFYLGSYNLLIEGICQSSGLVGYEYDEIMMVKEKGENNYGLLTLDAVGGGCP